MRFYEGVGVGVGVGDLKIGESESESEVLCADSTALLKTKISFTFTDYQMH
jgi:hypothetical protein